MPVRVNRSPVIDLGFLGRISAGRRHFSQCQILPLAREQQGDKFTGTTCTHLYQSRSVFGIDYTPATRDTARCENVNFGVIYDRVCGVPVYALDQYDTVDVVFT